MGPKKEKLDREPTIKRRPLIEFSDTEFISEDEDQSAIKQTVRDIYCRQVPPEENKKLLRNRLGSSNIHLEKRLDRPKTGRQDVTRQPRVDKIPEEIFRPKLKKRSDESGASKRICSSMFLWQLFITVFCVALVNFTQVPLLNQSAHVSDRTVNINVDNKVKEVIDRKLPKTLDTHLQHLVHDEAKAAVTDLTSVIDTKIAEQKRQILSDIEKSVSPRIDEVEVNYDSFADNLLQEKTTVEEVVKNVNILNGHLQSVKGKQGEVQETIENLFSNLHNKSSDIKELSENYARLAETTESHSNSNLELQETLKNEHQEARNAITSIRNELNNLQDNLLNAKEFYEEYKDKLEQLHEVNRKLEQIQPNMFNKDHRYVSQAWHSCVTDGNVQQKGISCCLP